MKRPIKFRGRVPDKDKADGGKIVFGSLVIYATGMYSHWIYTEGADRNYPVDSGSVAQLVGYDCDGNEVYEGDTLVDKEGNGFTARLVCRVLDDKGFLLYIPLEQLKLTEATT